MATPPSDKFLGIISWYGLLIVLGAALAVFLADREARRQRLPDDLIVDLALRVLPLGILGARIYYVLFSLPAFAKNPVSVLYIWQGGLAIYGGLIAGALTVLVFCRRRKIPVLRMLDILVPGVALAQAIGRWGNYFNQEAYGWRISDSSALAFFPAAVLIQESNGASWHLAAFFYESVLDISVFLFLIWGRRKLFRKQGDLFLFYLLLYAAGRLVIENLRTDSLYLGSSVRISQLFSVLLCVIVTGILFLRRRKSGKMSPAAVIPVLISFLFHALLLWYAAGGNLPFLQARTDCVLFLGAYSLCQVICSLILYGSSRTENLAACAGT